MGTKGGSELRSSLAFPRLNQIPAISASVISTIFDFSLARSGVVAPGIGMMVGVSRFFDTARIQLISSWEYVHPLLWAIVSIRLASLKLDGNALGWNLEKSHRRLPSGLPSGVSSMVMNRPVSSPDIQAGMLQGGMLYCAEAAATPLFRASVENL
jgi:hypothetical protein